ncbi:diguanylate cyclase (GGDEF) domain-containing protein [Treponema bryantii]|uniref:Diguanylate cyclase (GGDEF) domain-containing protein n=1 Tax=Treponema bryantii TaxID=163 RepID=A0A1H9FRR2_9SPIR|nr:GGDEF domain-containing protein [Treponema bryantii]SEQ40459.1 diguanylate cyclase (GGDEF) domain-containing protein [Treponema bryantii]
MYNVAVLVHNFAVEYADQILHGIYRYFSDKKDVRVFFAQTRTPHIIDGLYDYQCWASVEYLTSKVIDEVIIVSNTYCLYRSRDELKELFRPFFSKKVISIGMDFDEPGVYYTTAYCDSVYDEIVGHLKNEHGCTKIAFFSANKIQSQEAEERFKAFKNALKKHNLEFHEEWVLNGAFTRSSARAELESKYHKKEDIEYEAIICANDLMGMAVLDYFSELGIKIPSEMKVFGFDNTSHSILCVPTLATVDQSIEEQGYAAAEFGMRLLKEEGTDFPKFVNTELKSVYRRSCGCEDFLEQKKRDVFNAAVSHYEEVRRVGNLFDVIKGTSSLSDFAESFKSIVDTSGFSKLVVFVLREPVTVMREGTFNMPDEARLLLRVDTKNGDADYFEESEYINIKESLFNRERMQSNPGCYIFQPVIMGTVQYGYLFCKAERTDFGMNSILLKVITSVIVQAYDYTMTVNQKRLLETMNKELKERNYDLSISSKTDELTHLLNRRGFMEYGQKLIFFSDDVDTNGIVFFADLDCLKTINDKYGHENGDKAIIAAAEVLRKTFRKIDIIGRLGGDEFGVIASGMDIAFLDKLREKIDNICVEISERNNLIFKLSMSIGAARFSPEYKDLNELLMMADQDLYEQKKIHHARIKN